MRLLYLCASTVAFIAAVTFAAESADAASLFVWSINTGQTTSPALPEMCEMPTQGTNGPQSTPSAKGFLIGIDFNDGLGDVFTAVQDLEFSGPIVQWQAPNYANDNGLPNSNVQTRSLGLLVNADGQDQPPGASNFLREDSYWWDSAQTIGGQSRQWSPVATGIEDGGAGSTVMTLTATLGSVGQNVPEGVAKLIYIVATGDIQISGTIARTSNPANATVIPDGFFLDYELGYWWCPEPSSFLLAGMGAVALALGAWRRGRNA